MGMLIHHTWLEQQKQQEKPKKTEPVPAEEPKPVEEPVNEPIKRGRRKMK